MGRDISISISAQDNFTATITKMKTATAQFKAEGVDLSKRLDELNKTKASLTVDFTKAQAELKAAKKGLDDTQESAERLNKAQLNYDNLKSGLNLVSKQASETEKAYVALSKAVETSHDLLKQEVVPAQITGPVSGTSAAKSGSGISTPINAADITSNFAWSTLANSELVKSITNTAAKASSQWALSAYGAETANQISSTVSGALSGMTSGAAIGSMIAPGIGTAVGGAIGTVVGGATSYLSAELDRSQEQDDYFKDYYQNYYNDLTSQYQASLENGKSAAASREQTNLAFETLLGSKGKALDWTSWMQDFAAATPFAFEDLTAMSKTALSYKFTTRQTKQLMQSVGDAGAALGLGGSDLSAVATYLGRMNSTDKVSLEYLNPLVERGIPAIDYIAAAMEEQTGQDWTTQDVYDAVSKGTLDGSDMVIEILQRMEEEFKGSMEKQAQTYDGLTSTLEDTMTNLDAAMGSGYTEARKGSLQAQIDFYGGENGDIMSEAYNLIGQWQASMDNTRDQLKMEALSGVMDTLDFKEAVASGTNDGAAEAGRMLAEALAQAEADYTNTEGYDLMVQTQKDVIEGVRDKLADANWDAGYDIGQEFSKGYEAGIISRKKEAFEAANELGRAAGAVGYSTWSPNVTYLDDPLSGGNSHAYGLDYVPYNDYPARLHQGERVMTASENREYSSGGMGGSVVITGNTFTVREEADIEKIGQEFFRQLSRAYMLRA